MKSLIIFAVFVASILSNPIAVNDRDHEANLRRILENQRYNFPCGWPNAGQNGVPPIDPLFIEQVVIVQDSIASSLTSTISNIFVRNLRTFVIEALEINSAARTLRYRINIPLLTLDARHETRGRMIGIPVVSGSGPMTSRATNAFIEGVISWIEQPDSGFIHFNDQIANFNSQNVVVQMDGFGLLTGTINRQINDMIPEVINDPAMQAQFNQILNDIMLPMLNEFTYQMTPAQAGEFLAHYAENLPPANC
ncbi:hypothetical protein ACKWTF_005175 [Chironomus riparius]